MNQKNKPTMLIYDDDIGVEILTYCSTDMDIVERFTVKQEEKMLKWVSQRIEPTQVVVAVESPTTKWHIVDKINEVRNSGLTFPNVLLTNSFFTEHTMMGEGNIVLMDSIVGLNTRIGDFNIIDMGVKVMPFCKIGDYNMVSEDLKRYTDIGDAE